MNECYYYLLLLSLFSSINSFHHSLINETNELISLPNITIQHVCENDYLEINCLNETIQIIRSMYGRTSQRICNNDLTYRVFDKTCANIEQSKYQTKFRCHGKSSCRMLINNQMFNDPCGLTIPKHFEIHYRCIDKDICLKLLMNCSKFNDLKCIEKVQEDFSCSCPSTICQYDNNQIIGFIENYCSEENLQGFHWNKTAVNKSQYLSCPSPCTGQVFRFCDLNKQWSNVDYTKCDCPINKSDQLSRHYSANSYVFQCNFWLINRLLPKDNSCILSFTNWNERHDDGSLNCLISAFQQMTCLEIDSFGIDFKNLLFEIYIPMKNQSQLKFFSNLQNQIILDRIEMNYQENLPIMAIDTKSTNPNNKSIILIEQKNNLTSIQTANVTIIFNHQSSKFRYQCRGYHSPNMSLHVDLTNMFFACQLLCSNDSHVICQCPYFNPFMHYMLYIDENNESIHTEKCSEKEEKPLSIEDNLTKIDRDLASLSSIYLAKKLLLFINRIIENDNFFSNWNIVHRILKQIESLGFYLINITNSFHSIQNHIEFYLKTNEYQFETHNRSVFISLINSNSFNENFRLIFSTISNRNINHLINSPIVSLNILPKNHSINHIRIIFRHLNQSNQIPTCAYLRNIEKNDVQWSTDGCQLLSTNLTHSICLYNHLSTFALFTGFEKSMMKSDDNQLLFISRIGCMISFICLLITIIILIIVRLSANMDDDLMIVRNILHTNMLFCLIIVQLLFLFGIDQIKHKYPCRIISILLDYFLLSSFSWMFVDGIELLIALKHVFKIDKIRILAYTLYSYGFPLLIIFMSITFSSKNEHSLNRYCWLSQNHLFIWTFAIPFILLIIGNLCLFIISIYSICKKLNPIDHTDKIRFSLRDISTISVLFGLTWIVALLYLYDETSLFAYIFTILNSFHGLLILIFYCLLQKSVRNFQFLSIFQNFVKPNQNENHTHTKSIEHFSLPDNTSSSGYSSGHSSDLINKQILSNPNYTNHQSHPISFYNHYDKRICFNNETSYLPSIPINLLTNRLSTFRYPVPSNEIVLSYEQNQQLLHKTRTHDDDHQYYEIS